MDKTIHLKTVEPGKSPGGLYLRLCTRSRLLNERAVNLESVRGAGRQDAALAVDAIRQGETVRLYVYDGDTGECLKTIIANKDGTLPAGHKRAISSVKQ